MPGLNQLKKFTEDIREVGDEVTIRAQRGEKIVSLPLPQGISEEDDSEDFIIGMPEMDKSDDSAPAEDSGAAAVEEPAPADIDVSGLDSVLEPQISADDDALSDFLNSSLDEPAAAQSEEAPAAAEETPLEDMDFESLLGGASLDSPDEFSTDESASQDTPSEEPVTEDASASAMTSDAALSDLFSDMSADAAFTDIPSDIPTDEALSDIPSDIPTDEALSDIPSDIPTDEALSDIPSDIPTDEALSDIPSGDASEPSFDGDSELPDIGLSDNILDSLGSIDDLIGDSSSEGDSEINLNDDIPASVLENDGVPPQENEPSDSAPESASDAEPSGSDSGFDFNTDMLDGFGEEGSDSLPPESAEIPDASMEVPSDFGSSDSGMDEVSLDSFDTSAMEGVDFGPTEPSVSGDDFPVTDDGLGGDDDFILDSSFEIPGFSDTETADMGKKRPILDTVDFSKGKPGRAKNSLTDEEYVQFKKNLANYPLNLRIALEDFIVRDEFTDEAVFEIIEKVLKKTSARQLATQLEKILDISINIPRDFERRSFAEYEAYKQSFQYQLKNRIIPAAIVGLILCFVCFGLFKAGEHFIYKPVMASINYKQGYTLLEANEFPQSEEKFREAVSYKPVKKWFFKYALGYRERKQYERAGQMYKNILAYFNHDKQAGLEYAEMELYDRANYERAEEIVRREVLDYHINDADGILLLGDVFLEWAEIDESKYELAKQEYLDLIQRYGGNDVYLSRMLRYNIRTDRLREVLTYKNIFYQSKQDRQNLKKLGASDWTELSGYLLEKLYGVLSKNDEYLRSSIEDVLAMLNLAIRADPSNPVARYNLAQYFIQNGNTEQAKVELERSLDLFSQSLVRNKKNVYREINATRILGELYAGNREYLKAQTVYTRGINLYNEEHEGAEFEGDENTGKLFADMGDLDYFISGELDAALFNYEKAIEIKNDTPSLNFRVGAIYYGKKDFDTALASFIKVAEKEPKDPNILLSLGNVLSLRGDNFAAESYYSDLLKVLETERDKVRYFTPQEVADDYVIVDMFLKANNNLGVTLYRLARQTGNSEMNAQAMVRLSDSMRAWDALTRNTETMIRMEGSNLAAQNSKYITHPYPDFEPAIYTDIPRILSGEKVIE